MEIVFQVSAWKLLQRNAGVAQKLERMHFVLILKESLYVKNYVDVLLHVESTNVSMSVVTSR
jgi:hypothetical protein